MLLKVLMQMPLIPAHDAVVATTRQHCCACLQPKPLEKALQLSMFHFFSASEDLRLLPITMSSHAVISVITCFFIIIA